MNILYISAISSQLNTSSSQRNLALIDGLIKNGNNLILIEPYAIEHSLFYDKHQFLNDKLRILYLGSDYLYTSMSNKYQSKIKQILRKVLIFWYDRMIIIRGQRYKLSTGIIKEIQACKVDLIISSSDPKTSHLLALKIKKKAKLIDTKWIQYWGDPLSTDITKKTVFPDSIIRGVEKSILNKATKIFYTSPATVNVQKQLFRKISKNINYIPTPYSDYSCNKDSEELYSLSSKKVFTIGYFGNYESSVRNIQPMINAILKLNKFRLIIAGYSNHIIKSKDNIESYPRVSRENVAFLQQSCDLLVVIMNRCGTQIPGKIYHYAGTRKPILVIIDGDYGNDIYKAFSIYNRFHFCQNSENEIMKEFNKISRQNREELPLQDFSSERVGKKFLSLVSS